MDEQVEHFETDGNTIETAEELSAREGIYGAIKRALIARGIPADEIAFIHDFKTPKKKAEAFAAANAGRIRVMLASTEKAGTGVNMQERLCALHHLDTPWRPSDIEQREGRILRQGNRFPAVHICTYVTENSFDGYMWQTLESKARFISQIMAGEVTARTADDVDQLVLNAAQIKAIASGNPQILEKVSLEVELTRLERLYSVWLANRRRLQWEADDLPTNLNQLSALVAQHEQAIAQRDGYEAQNKAFALHLKSALLGEALALYTDRARAGAQLRKLAFTIAREARRKGRLTMEIGKYVDFSIIVKADGRGRDGLDFLEHDLDLSLRFVEGGPAYTFKLTDTDAGIVQSIDAVLRSLEARLTQTQARHAEMLHRYEQVKNELDKGWEHAARYQELKTKLLALNATLSAAGQEIEASPDLTDLDATALQPVPEKVSLHQLAGLHSVEPAIPNETAGDSSTASAKVTFTEPEARLVEPLDSSAVELPTSTADIPQLVAPAGKRQAKRRSVVATQLHFDFAEA